MKLKNIFLAVFAAGAALVACDPENGLDSESFEVSANPEVTIEKIGGSYSFSVESSFDWNIRGVEDAADWLDVTVDGQSITSKNDVIKGSTQNHEVEIAALANTGKDRAVTLTLFADIKHQVTVKVTQTGDLGDGVITTTVADLVANPSKEATYRLSGTVSGFNASYCSFDLTDATGTIYVYSMEAESKAKYQSVIKNGGTITITGQYEYYEAKSQHEIVKAVVEEYTPAEGGDPDKATDATVAEFIQKADVVGYYRLSGKVSGFNETYFSFDLTDDTGSIYVYSVEDASKTAWAGKVKNGYNVVIRGQYAYYAAKSQHEVVNAIIDSVEEAAAEQLGGTGLVVALSTAGFLVKTSDAILYVFDKEAVAKVKLGDNVTVNGEKSVYNGVTEIVNCEVTVNSSNNEVVHPAVTALDATAFDAYETLFGYVKFSGKLAKSGNYYNIKVKDAARTGSLSNPVSVDAALVDKWVDVTGYFVGISGSSYFNVITTDLALSADQHEGEEEEEEADATVGENEVGYELTNAEIVAAFASSEVTKDTYGDYSITSATGTWSGNMNTKKGLTFIQLRNKTGAHLKSPEFSSNIKRIVLKMNEKTVVRTMYALPADTQIPTSGDNYVSSLWANSLGTVSTKGGEETVVMSVTGSAKSFTLIAGNGAVYINSILVICEK
jgi:RPA family protein